MTQLQVRCIPYFVQNSQPKAFSSFGEKVQAFITKRINEDYNSIIEDMFNGFDIAERNFENGVITMKITPNWVLEKRYNVNLNDIDGVFDFICKNFPKSRDVVDTDKYQWKDLNLKFFKNYEIRLALTEISV